MFCNFEDVLKYHPLIEENFALPEFLCHYCVVHDTASLPDVTLPVLSLYHFIIDDLDDRQALLPFH